MKMSGSAQVEMSGFRGAMSPGSRMDGQGAGRNEQERIGVASFLERFEAEQKARTKAHNERDALRRKAPSQDMRQRCPG